MEQKSSSERLAEAMERARRQSQAQRKAEAAVGIPPVRSPHAFTIALSREAGANGSQVACAVGERLGWAVYDRELVQHIAADMGVRTSLLESVDEKDRSWLLECLESFASAPTVSESAYARHLLETLVSLSAHGGCVIVGRGAAQVLPTAVMVRVRLVGPVEDRVKAVGQRLGIPHEEAKRRVQKTDGERVRFVKDHFQKDPTDPRVTTWYSTRRASASRSALTSSSRPCADYKRVRWQDGLLPRRQPCLSLKEGKHECGTN
jgi:cytidylate kinase